MTGRSTAYAPIRNDREARWRAARYDFLREHATRLGARIVTAHTADDHLETVVMRVLRGSGARGLAGLLAPSALSRPFVEVTREQLESFARNVGLAWHVDPSNASRDFLRNRVRHEILPALRAVVPEFAAWLAALSRRAAHWRGEVEQFVDDVVRLRLVGTRTLYVASAELAGYDQAALAVLWVAICGRLGVILDRRGTQAIAAFTVNSPRIGRVLLAGNWCLEALGEQYVLRQARSETAAAIVLPENGAVEWGSFRFRVTHLATHSSLLSSPWFATLTSGSRVVVRRWRAGDRLAASGQHGARRVARYFADAGVRGREREEWPVVTTGDDVIWIPGVRRSDAATDRSGGPVRHFVCERIDR